MRRLWKGEVVFGHDGPAGKFPVLHLDASFDEDIPLGLVAFGPNSLALAGRCFDTVVLHTFFTDETVERCVATVRARGRGGRAGSRRRCASGRATRPSATICPTALRLKKTVGRLATYLQGYGDLLVATNGWDPEVLARFRADEVVSSVPGAHRHEGRHRRARARRHAAARRVARAGRHRRRRDGARRGCCASSTSASTA